MPTKKQLVEQIDARVYAARQQGFKDGQQAERNRVNSTWQEIKQHRYEALCKIASALAENSTAAARVAAAIENLGRWPQ